MVEHQILIHALASKDILEAVVKIVCVYIDSTELMIIQYDETFVLSLNFSISYHHFFQCSIYFRNIYPYNFIFLKVCSTLTTLYRD